MPTCTFFGHSNCPETIRTALKTEIANIHLLHGVSMFYVGNNGRFDTIVRSVLRELGYNYAVVLAYLPTRIYEYEDYSDTMLPEGIETVPKRFAISWRNKWMIKNSDYAITYISHDWGGAAKFAQFAEQCGKIIINIAESP